MAVVHATRLTLVARFDLLGTRRCPALRSLCWPQKASPAYISPSQGGFLLGLQVPFSSEVTNVLTRGLLHCDKMHSRSFGSTCGKPVGLACSLSCALSHRKFEGAFAFRLSRDPRWRRHGHTLALAQGRIVWWPRIAPMPSLALCPVHWCKPGLLVLVRGGAISR